MREPFLAFRGAVYAAVLSLVVLAQNQQPAEPPLPDAARLKERALASMKQSEKDLERYDCVLHEEIDELNGDGSVKKHRASEKETFFVSGKEIVHTLSRNGKPLSGDEAKKEQDRVDREVKKYSDPKQAQRAEHEAEHEAEMFLRSQRFYNGHREMRDGRSTVIYGMAGDPSFRPTSIEERFAQAASGRIWLDEQSGQPVEMRMKLDHDLKVGGGLLANVHKGFWVHTIQQRQSDGVWLAKLVEGSGDARAGLFFHPRVRFKEVTDGCHLFSVETLTTTQGPK